MTRQNQRRSFLENYVSKDQNEKMRTMAFKEKMDKEEIVHLKQEESKLQEKPTAFKTLPRHQLAISSVNDKQ